jgi:hypothetical protein
MCAASLVACSSKEDSGAQGAGGATVEIDAGGFGASTGAGTGTFDGGRLPIGPEQVAELRDGACAAWESEGEALPVALELVVDVSSSMSSEAPGSDSTKWEVTRDALLEAIVGVEGPGLPATASAGLLFYPNKKATVNREPGEPSDCVNLDAMVPIRLLGGPDAEHRELVRQRIAGAVLETSTPTHDAYYHALEQGVLGSSFGGQRFMLLITDGEPTLLQGCMNESGSPQSVDPEPIVDEIRRAANAGIKTFLIGSPGSENNREWMSRAAVIGGTAPADCDEDGPNYCHMDMTTAPDFSAALRSGLSDVVGMVAPCIYAFAEPPAGQELVLGGINVVLQRDGEAFVIIRDDIGDCTEGWRLTEDNQILLCPTTCDDVQQNPRTTVDVLFGCAAIPTDVR